MSNQVLKERAERLLALHQPGNPVVLPTVWDAWSARLAVDAGFAALTVGSHPVADSVGKADQEGMTYDDVVTRVKQITAAVDVPVSVDIESGYAESPTILITGLLEAGAVGLNIEDTVHSEGGRLRSSSEHAELVGALRKAADATGVHVVINARTDLFLRQDGDESDRVDRAIAGLKKPRRQAPIRCTQWAVTIRIRCGAWLPSCHCRSTRSRCRIRMIRRRSGRWVLDGSVSGRSCRGCFPDVRRRSWPAGLSIPA